MNKVEQLMLSYGYNQEDSARFVALLDNFDVDDELSEKIFDAFQKFNQKDDVFLLPEILDKENAQLLLMCEEAYKGSYNKFLKYAGQICLDSLRREDESSQCGFHSHDKLADIAFIDYDGLEKKVGADFVDIFHVCPQSIFLTAEELSTFSSYECTEEYPNAQSGMILSKLFPQLQEIVFDGAKQISGSVFETLPKSIVSVLIDDCEGLVVLDGIDRLVSLKAFECGGPDGTSYINKKIDDEVSCDIEHEMKIYHSSLVKNHGKTEISCAGVIRNFSPLLKCHGLEHLSLDNQHSLQSLDLANFPKLKHLSLIGCVNLEKLSNIDVLTKNFSKCKYRASPNEYMFDISRCPKLKNSKVLVDFVESVIRSKNFVCTEESEDERQNFITLDVALYQDMIKCSPKIVQQLRKEKQEKLQNSIDIKTADFFLLTPEHVDEQKRFAKFILTKQCDIEKDDSVITKVKKVYSWVTRNITYDDDALCEIDDNECVSTLKHASVMYYAFPNKNEQMETGEIHGKCICAGFADTFSFLLNELGIENQYVGGITSTGELHAYNRVKINDDWYYFDSVADAGNVVFGCFCLTKKQMAQHGQTKKGMLQGGGIIHCDTEAGVENARSLQFSLKHSKV